MYKVNRCKTSPSSLAMKKSYNDFDVTRQLKHDFHNKCYICEDKEVDIVVEHFLSHKNNEALKFDWDNLFYGCQHCNLMKKENQYEGKILNCCEEDVLHCISYRVNNNDVETIPQNDSEKTRQTAKLISNVFNYKNTGIREIDCEKKLKRLKGEVTAFKNNIILYYKYLKNGEDKEAENVKKQIIAMLSKKTDFSAFKKWIIKEKSEKFSEFVNYIDY